MEDAAHEDVVSPGQTDTNTVPTDTMNKSTRFDDSWTQLKNLQSLYESGSPSFVLNIFPFWSPFLVPFVCLNMYMPIIIPLGFITVTEFKERKSQIIDSLTGTRSVSSSRPKRVRFNGNAMPPHPSSLWPALS